MDPADIPPNQTADSPAAGENGPLVSQNGPEQIQPEAAQPRGLLGTLKMDRSEMLVALVLMAFSAWLWSRLPGNIGTGAPFYGAAVGLAITYLARYSC